MEEIALSQEEFNRRMIRMTEFFDPVIQQKKNDLKSAWRDLIPEGLYKLGQGLVRQLHTFYPGRDSQSGALTWRQIETYREPGTNGQDDPGNDPCRYNAYMINYGFKTESMYGYETYRRSPHYCIKDFVWDWEFQQQLEMILNSFGDTSIQVWENISREMYLHFATKRVLSGNPYEGNFTYNPLTSTKIVVPSTLGISTMTRKNLDAVWQLLSMQVGSQGAIAMDSGMPTYGLEIHPFDFDDMLHRDSSLHGDMQYFDASVLVEGVGSMKKFRGWGLAYHQTPPRFEMVSKDANGNNVFDRINPYDEETITQGSKWEPSVAYQRAQYTLITAIIKGVYERQIPPAPPSKIDGASFETKPNNGTFEWINNKDDETNPRGEKGFFFAGYNMFAKPLPNHEYAISMLVKRQPHTPIDLGDTAPDAVAATIVCTDFVAVNPDGADTYWQVDVTLTTTVGLTQKAIESVTVTFVDNTTAVVLITGEVDSPTKYRLTFASAADWIINGGGIKNVICT